MTTITAAELDYLDGAGYVEIVAMDGNRGFVTLTHRASTITTSVSYWTDLQVFAAAERRLAEIHRRAVGKKGSEPRIERFEVLTSSRMAPLGVDSIALLNRVRLPPSLVPTAVEFYRDEIFPELRSKGGLCSTELLVNRDTEDGSVLTVWDNDDNATAAWSVLPKLGAQPVETVGMRFASPRVFDTVRGTLPS